jgi:hypothetical protein
MGLFHLARSPAFILRGLVSFGHGVKPDQDNQSDSRNLDFSQPIYFTPFIAR